MTENIKILMIDDHPMIIEGYQNTLRYTKKDSQELEIDIANSTISGSVDEIESGSSQAGTSYTTTSSY